MMVGLNADVSVQTHRKIKKRKKEKEKLLIYYCRFSNTTKRTARDSSSFYILRSPLFLSFFLSLLFAFLFLSLVISILISFFLSFSPIPTSVLLLRLLLFFRATLYSTSGSWPSLPQTHRIRSVEAESVISIYLEYQILSSF